MKRVLVLGSPGAGKSTLAAQLATRTGLPLIHLDQQYWQAGWVEPDKESWRARVAEIAARDEWIIDGNYGGTLAVRLARADTVILLDFPTHLCLLRVLRRSVTGRGRVRPDMAEGCPERFDPAFFTYVARYRRDAGRRNGRLLENFSGQLIRLRRPREIERLLASFDKRG